MFQEQWKDVVPQGEPTEVKVHDFLKKPGELIRMVFTISVPIMIPPHSQHKQFDTGGMSLAAMRTQTQKSCYHRRL